MLEIQLNHKFLNPLKFKKELHKESKLFKFQDMNVKPWHRHLGSNWRAEAQMLILRHEKHHRITILSAQRCICSSSSLGLSNLCHSPHHLPSPKELH